MSELFIATYLGIIGICFGSFANAAVWRLHNRRDIIKERSECVHCHHKLGALDLIPVLSWLYLRGRCRYCRRPIEDSPLVEIAVAIFFITSYLIWPFNLDGTLAIVYFTLWLVFGIALSILFVYDLRWYLLPDKLTYPLIIVGLIAAIVRVYAGSGDITLLGVIMDIIFSALAIGGLYGLLYAVSQGRWVGLGDVKLGISLGLFLGWPLAIMCVMTANLLGCLVVLPGLLTKKITPTSRVPFGPFLILGFIFAGLIGQRILNWYLNTLGY